MITILFLAANPTDGTRLRLDEECRAIDQALRQAEYRDRFEIRQHWAVRIADLQGHLLRHQPHIVHFSGHGSTTSEITNRKAGRDLKLLHPSGYGSDASSIILEDNSGNSQPMSARALSSLFSVLKDNVRCVVLNACYSQEQAQAIAQHIDCVVGMSAAIGDRAAISFAASFYQALGYGRDVKTAFELGCVQIDMENLGQQDLPQLLATKRQPSEIFLAGKPGQLSGSGARKTGIMAQSGGVSFDNISDDVTDNIIAGGGIRGARGGEMTIFDQRGQHVNYQYNAAGNINFGAVQNRLDVVEQLEKLKAEIAKAAGSNALDQDTATDVEYKVQKALQQAKKPEPDKKSIVDYLSEGKQLLAGLAGGAAALGGLITAFTQAIEVVQKVF
jgi:hypothetical protein